MSYIDVRYDDRLPEPDQFALASAVTVELPGGLSLTMEAGFVSDGASVPRALWSLLPPIDNRVLLAYVVHDYLYVNWESAMAQFATQSSTGMWGLPSYLDRLLADGVMLELSRAGAPELEWRNRLYYYAVRCFGGGNWKRFRAEAARRKG